VTEPGTNQPVVDATVNVYLLADPPPKILFKASPEDLIVTTKTGIDGGFVGDGRASLRLRTEVALAGGIACPTNPSATRSETTTTP